MIRNDKQDSSLDLQALHSIRGYFGLLHLAMSRGLPQIPLTRYSYRHYSTLNIKDHDQLLGLKTLEILCCSIEDNIPKAYNSALIHISVYYFSNVLINFTMYDYNIQQSYLQRYNFAYTSFQLISPQHRIAYWTYSHSMDYNQLQCISLALTKYTSHLKLIALYACVSHNVEYICFNTI